MVNSGRTCAVEQNENLELLFHDWLFRALELAGEKIIHHERRDESRDAKILLLLVIQHMESKFITSAGKPREQLVHREFLFVSPLGNRV